MYHKSWRLHVHAPARCNLPSQQRPIYALGPHGPSQTSDPAPPPSVARVWLFLMSVKRPHPPPPPLAMQLPSPNLPEHPMCTCLWPRPLVSALLSTRHNDLTDAHDHAACLPLCHLWASLCSALGKQHAPLAAHAHTTQPGVCHWAKDAAHPSGALASACCSAVGSSASCCVGLTNRSRLKPTTTLHLLLASACRQLLHAIAQFPGCCLRW